jgi:hypothetical protein
MPINITLLQLSPYSPELNPVRQDNWRASATSSIYGGVPVPPPRPCSIRMNLQFTQPVCRNFGVSWSRAIVVTETRSPAFADPRRSELTVDLPYYVCPPVHDRQHRVRLLKREHQYDARNTHLNEANTTDPYKSEALVRLGIYSCSILS